MKHAFAPILALVLPLAAPAAECEDGFCPIPTAEETAAGPVFEVVSPVPEAAVAPIAPAPRLDTLDGKTVALVGGSFMASVTHPELRRLLLAEFPTAKVLLLDEIGSAGPYPRPGVGTGIGLLPVLFGSRRLNCLGILLLPIACNMSGFGYRIIALLGLD